MSRIKKQPNVPLDRAQVALKVSCETRFARSGRTDYHAPTPSADGLLPIVYRYYHLGIVITPPSTAASRGAKVYDWNFQAGE
ncbi:MAG TPA: hypothetical protein VFM05_11575 [Candidatus Saccharimonadales bacterium]|nr:hypothetical protein [Candidatus Saccharimonadales bacterium]